MKNKAIWIGAIIGLVWGFFSFFSGVAVFETGQKITFIKILLTLPAYLVEILFGRSYPYYIIASTVIGLFIGAIAGLIIHKIRKGKR